MKISRATDQRTAKGSGEWFTGDVYVDNIALDGSGISGGVVHFTPGARTAWHTHALGQTIHIIEGVGLVQREGEARMEVRPGDTVFFEPGENHWHGAAPDHVMVHVAIVRIPEAGDATTWGTLVTDEEYGE